MTPKRLPKAEREAIPGDFTGGAHPLGTSTPPSPFPWRVTAGAVDDSTESARIAHYCGHTPLACGRRHTLVAGLWNQLAPAGAPCPSSTGVCLCRCRAFAQRHCCACDSSSALGRLYGCTCQDDCTLLVPPRHCRLGSSVTGSSSLEPSLRHCVTLPPCPLPFPCPCVTGTGAVPATPVPCDLCSGVTSLPSAQVPLLHRPPTVTGLRPPARTAPNVTLQQLLEGEWGAYCKTTVGHGLAVAKSFAGVAGAVTSPLLGGATTSVALGLQVLGGCRTATVPVLPTEWNSPLSSSSAAGPWLHTAP